MSPAGPRLRPTSFAVAAVVLMAACSSADDTAPPTAPALTTTSPSTETATTTSTPAETTTPTDAPAPAETATATSTTASPTTTTPTPTTAAPVPVGPPTPNATPIFAGSSNDAWLHLGSWTGSGWAGSVDEAGTPVAVDLAEGAQVTIAELGQTPVAGTVGPDGEACVVEPDTVVPGPVIAPNAGVPDVPGFGYRAIALPATWNVHPREAVSIEQVIPAYADAGVAAFAGDDVETQAGEVDQTVVADLDGDGDTEVLVVFGHEDERIEGQTTPTGGFSALLLLDADSQAASTVAKSFSTLSDDGASAGFDTHRVLDVADLNGDGIAEVIVHTWFTGGASVTVYDYDGAALNDVLRAGCGT